jgi:hypothetical protein
MPEPISYPGANGGGQVLQTLYSPQSISTSARGHASRLLLVKLEQSRVDTSKMIGYSLSIFLPCENIIIYEHLENIDSLGLSLPNTPWR